VDFVSAIGLTLGFETVMEWNDNYGADDASYYAFGIGYTYDAGKWCIGGKLMALPVFDGGVGFNIPGTYWFNEHVGLTGIFNSYFGVGDTSWTAFGLRVGISMKF